VQGEDFYSVGQLVALIFWVTDRGVRKVIYRGDLEALKESRAHPTAKDDTK